MMKKVFLITLMTVGFFTTAQAQNADFGVTAGFLNAGGKVSAGGSSVSDSQAGFYVGGLVDIEINETFHVQPEVLLAVVDESTALFIPVLGKYYVADKFHVLAGPEFGFSLEETGPDSASLSLNITGGIGYDFTDALFAEARYAQQVNNAYTGNLDITARGNGLFIGVGYKF